MFLLRDKPIFLSSTGQEYIYLYIYISLYLNSVPCIFCQKLLFHYSFFFNHLFLIKKEIEVSNEKNGSLLIGLTAPLLC